MIVTVGPSSHCVYHHDIVMICATREAAIFSGIWGKVRHRNIIVLTDKYAGLWCGLVQCIYGAHNLVDQVLYSHAPHNDISVIDGPLIWWSSHKIIIL